MTRSVRVNATMDAELLRRVEAFAKGRYEDRSTAIRQLLDFALRELDKREAMDAYRAGRVTLREFARTLGMTVWSAHDLLAAEGVDIARGTRSETRAVIEEALAELAGGRERAAGRATGASARRGRASGASRPSR